ncbi:MAG: hypothetical protein WBV76_07330, partial [Pseudolabrys sp.]
TQRANVFGDPNAHKRFEGFGHISHSSIAFPRLHVSLPVISVLILSHAASVEDVDQAQGSTVTACPDGTF